MRCYAQMLMSSHLRGVEVWAAVYAQTLLSLSHLFGEDVKAVIYRLHVKSYLRGKDEC